MVPNLCSFLHFLVWLAPAHPSRASVCLSQEAGSEMALTFSMGDPGAHPCERERVAAGVGEGGMEQCRLCTASAHHVEELWSWSGLAVLPPAGCPGQAFVGSHSSGLSRGSSSCWGGCDLGKMALCSGEGWQLKEGAHSTHRYEVLF